jgi:hypothetical protein
MQMTIDVPDTLPQERLKQRIKELESGRVGKRLYRLPTLNFDIIGGQAKRRLPTLLDSGSQVVR